MNPPALRAESFIQSIGVNVHMEYTDGAYASESNVAAELAYLGVTRIRDMIPSSDNSYPAQDQIAALKQLAAAGIKMDLFVGQAETVLGPDITMLNTLETANPGSILAVEGPNEINNFPITYNGLYGQQAANALQSSLFSMVNADSALNAAAVYDYTGGVLSPVVASGTVTKNASGSYTEVSGVAGWQTTLPTGTTKVTITYTGANPSAVLDQYYPGQGPQNNATTGSNGTLTFIYNNTSGAPLQTYITVSNPYVTTTITGISAVDGNSGNLVMFDPVTSLAGLADDANIHPYPSNGAPPGSYIPQNYIGVYGSATPGPRVITEDGYSTDPNDPNAVNLHVQAQDEVKILLDAYASGVSTTFLYELLDEKADPGNTNTGLHFGLFTSSYTAKPAAVAIHNLTTILADPGANALTFQTGSLNWSATGLPATAQTLLLEKSSGAFDLAFWNEPASGRGNVDVTVSLGAVYQKVEIFDPIASGAARSILTNVSSLTLPLGGDPLIVEIEPPTKAASITPGNLKMPMQMTFLARPPAGMAAAQTAPGLPALTGEVWRQSGRAGVFITNAHAAGSAGPGAAADIFTQIALPYTPPHSGFWQVESKIGLG